LLLALLALGCLAAPLTNAHGADFAIEPDSFKVRMLDAEGNQEDAAGSHPDRLQIDFGISLEGSETTPRDLVFELPPGFAGNPGAVPDCPRELFEKGEGECPPESQVGLLRFTLLEGQKLELPIFELEPTAGEVIAFGSEPAVGLALSMELRPDDFGITLRGADLAEAPITEGHAELWGTPANRQQGTTIPARPLLTAPTRCGALSFTFRTRSWQEGAPWLSASTELETPLSGCESLAFRPRLGLQLDNPLADSPTGLRMEVSVPLEEEGSTRADAQIEDVTIELPDGVTLSPGGAQTVTACSDTQLGLGSNDPALCPASSRVGTVELASPSLPEPLPGVLYLGGERPGERFRFFIVAQGPGTVLKFVGAMQADPLSGRLSAQLGDLPQAPISRLSMSFDGGPGALLATPLGCGPVEASGSFAPYGSGPPVQSSVEVAINGRAGWRCPGLGPFEPRLLASSTRPEAGRLTAFSTTLLREEGEQLPRRFSIALPPGLSAALGAVEPCPEAAASASACSAASRIGEVLARAGSGPSPMALPGDVYLTGPYRRAPFGLLMQLRAAVGPFDLGTISFRAQIQVSSRNGRVTVFSDPLPGAIEGMPVRFRSIEIDLNRPGFVRNPTACGPLSVEATIEAEGGANALAANTLGLRGCRKLGFRPRIHLSFVSRGVPPGEQSLQVAARPRRGDTNLRSMRITLPAPLRFDVSRLDQLCSRYDALAGDCPPGSQVGTARAQTELLGTPLRGRVYVALPSGKGQPDLWFSLGAMGVRLALRARTSIDDGRLVTNLEGLPDMPLSSLAIRFRGGKSGALALRGGPCRHGLPRRFESAVEAVGQNGSRRTMRLPVGVKARCQ
jgi:hypothetical protein